MTIKTTLSRSELKRLRALLEQDWPGIDEAIVELESGLQENGVADAQSVVGRAVTHGLAGYHASIYLVNVLGKISDPIRLATFISYLIDALVLLKPCQSATNCDLADAEQTDCRKNFYELFVEGSLRETLRDNGYEQQILVGGSDRLLRANVGSGDLHAYGMGG
jgi:hypothetical protein